MKKYKIHFKIFLLIFLISIRFSLAQEKDIYKGQNTIYYELFGTSGTPVSIQYDRVLFVNPKGYFNASLGFGTFFKNDLKYFTIPSSINYTIGIKKSHFEIGIPIIYRSSETNKYEKKHIFYGVKFAYKYQAKNKIFFKVSTNLLEHYEIKDTTNKDCDFLGCAIDWDKLKYILGFSLGYSF